MKAAVPIPYIIALILGIIVLALLGFWLFRIGGGFGGGVSEATCRSYLIAFCQRWASPLEGIPYSDDAVICKIKQNGETKEYTYAGDAWANCAFVGTTGKGCEEIGINKPNEGDCKRLGF